MSEIALAIILRDAADRMEDLRLHATAALLREASSEIAFLQSRVEEMNDVFGRIRCEVVLPKEIYSEIDKVMIQETR